VKKLLTRIGLLMEARQVGDKPTTRPSDRPHGYAAWDQRSAPCYRPCTRSRC